MSKGQPGLPVIEERSDALLTVNSGRRGESHNVGEVVWSAFSPDVQSSGLIHGLDVEYGRIREDLKGPGQLNSLVCMLARLLRTSVVLDMSNY